MKQYFYKLTAAASTATLLALPRFASAQAEGLGAAQTTLGAVGTAGKLGASNAETLPALVGNGINAILGILGIVLVVYLVWAGFIWMTAAGDPKKVETATSMIKQAIIGMVIVIGAYAIASFVISTLISSVQGT